MSIQFIGEIKEVKVKVNLQVVTQIAKIEKIKGEIIRLREKVAKNNIYE